MMLAALVLAVVFALMAFGAWFTAMQQLKKMQGEAIHRAQVYALIAIFWMLGLIALASWVRPL